MAKTSKRKKSSKNYLYIAPVMLWMAFIFYMSSRTGADSSSVSNPITGFIVDLFQRVRNDTPQVIDSMTGVVEIMVRKGAHMTEYGVLLALVLLAVRKTGDCVSYAMEWVWSVSITFAYACSDELHQLFVADRAGRATDVMIDMCGALAVMLIILGMRSTRGRIVTGFVIALLAVALVLFLLLWPF